MNFGIYPNLTKAYILKHISQEQIMEFYLGIPVVENKLFIAPPIIRANDNTPTCSFYYNEHGRLRFRDFGGDFWGDSFDVVARHLGINSKGKKEFQLIIHTIAKDFRIHKYELNKEVVSYDKVTENFFNKKKVKEKTIFRIVPRQWNYHDDGYWQKFNIDRALLYHGLVYPAREVYTIKKGYETLIYKYSTSDPAYCYFGGRDVNGIEDWKVYYPYRKKGEVRFHTNSSFLQGKHLIKGGEFAVITKAYKDTLSFRSFGIQAVAPPAESVLLSKFEHEFMAKKFKFLVGCMDYDRTGLRMMRLLKKTYDINSIMFTNGTKGTIDYKVKDFAEYVAKYGVEDTKQLLQNTYNKYIKLYK